MKESRSLQIVQAGRVSAVSRVGLPSQSRKYFEYDRTQVQDRLSAMTTTAQDNALEVEMIAAEKIFEETICEEFARVANEFTSLAEKLTSLNGRVMKAKGYPSV
jgi:hypothetical protein